MTKRFLKRPLSHSQLSSWEYSKEDWFRRYVKGEKFEGNAATRFGNVIGDQLGTPESPIPELSEQGIKEYTARGVIGDIHLIGHLDGWCPDTLTLHENKTSETKGRWTQGKADKHKQIDMYLLLLHQQDGVAPEDVTCYLNFIQTRPTGLGYRLHKEPKWRQFRVATKSQADLEAYSEYVVKTVEAMAEYIEQQELSTVAPSAPVFKGV